MPNLPPLQPPLHRAQRQRGFALATTLLIILVLGLLAAALFRSGKNQNTNAGSAAEHQRAQRIAEDALRYGEWMLLQIPQPVLVAQCRTLIDLDIGGSNNVPTTCQNALTNATSPPWTVGMAYTPSGMTVHTGGGLTASSGSTPGDVNYASRPMLYIQQLGPDPAKSSNTLYQITAAGFGGRIDSVSVVQSVVTIGTGT